ncbi:organic cation transporter protein-like [Dermacentor andersoni]|uniref:organic cation transporter protein-like n=1 Tax=Dermacentor andersoni TaxID=34620 RepID=UPI0024161002|nr:solute carrier family 22 member 3-like [Dermacentor andersoni]
MLAAGYVADHAGRKLVIQLCVGILLATTMGIAFADSYAMYVTTRFIDSAVVTSVFVISCVLLFEVSSHDHRHVHTSVAMGVGVTLADIWFNVLKQVHTGWRVRQGAILAPTVLLTSAFFLVEESPRWLVFKQGIKAAEVATFAAAKINGFSLPTTAAMMVKLKDEMLRNQEALLQRTPYVARDAISVQRSLFVMSITYASVTFALYTFLKSPVHKSDAWARWMAVIFQSMCYALMARAVKRFTRRQVATAYFLALGVLGLLTSATMSSANYLPALFVPLCYSLTKACAFVALTVNFCYGLELFLTPVRGVAMCWMFACGRTGSVAAYLLSALPDIGIENIELAIMAVLAFLSALILQSLLEVVSHASLSCTETTRVSVGRDGSKLDLEHMKLTLTTSLYEKIKAGKKHDKVSVKPSRRPSVAKSETSRSSKTKFSRTVE